MSTKIALKELTLAQLNAIRTKKGWGWMTNTALVAMIIAEYAGEVTPVDAASKPEVDKYAELFAGLKTQADVDALPPAAHREWWRRAKLELDANDAKVRQAWIDGGGR